MGDNKIRSEHWQRFVDASTRRAKDHHVIQATWNERHVFEVGGAEPPERVVKTGRVPEDAPIFRVGIPHVRREFSLPKSLSLHGTMMRFKTHSLSIVDELNIQYLDHEASNNGDYSRTTLPPNPEVGEMKRGMLHYRQDINAYSTVLGLLPIMLSVRAIDDPVFHRHGDFSSDGVEEDGTYRVEFGMSKPNRTLRRVEKFWFDPSKDFAAVRYADYRVNRVNAHVRLIDEMEIEPTDDPDFGWMPTSWVWRRYRLQDRLSLTIRASEVTLSSQPTTKRDFDLPFSPGTRVHQRRGDGTIWVVSESGELVVED